MWAKNVANVASAVKAEAAASADHNGPETLNLVVMPEFCIGEFIPMPGQMTIEGIVQQHLASTCSPALRTESLQSLLKLESTRRLLTSCFWYSLLQSFRTDSSQSYREALFCSMSLYYTTTLHHLVQGFPTLPVKVFSECIAHVLHTAFNTCFAYDRDRFTVEFQGSLQRSVAVWFCGVLMADLDVSTWHQENVARRHPPDALERSCIAFQEWESIVNTKGNVSSDNTTSPTTTAKRAGLLTRNAFVQAASPVDPSKRLSFEDIIKDLYFLNDHEEDDDAAPKKKCAIANPARVKRVPTKALPPPEGGNATFMLRGNSPLVRYYLDHVKQTENLSRSERVSFHNLSQSAEIDVLSASNAFSAYRGTHATDIMKSDHQSAARVPWCVQGHEMIWVLTNHAVHVACTNCTRHLRAKAHRVFYCEPCKETICAECASVRRKAQGKKQILLSDNVDWEGRAKKLFGGMASQLHQAHHNSNPVSRMNNNLSLSIAIPQDTDPVSSFEIQDESTPTVDNIQESILRPTSSPANDKRRQGFQDALKRVENERRKEALVEEVFLNNVRKVVGKVEGATAFDKNSARATASSATGTTPGGVRSRPVSAMSSRPPRPLSACSVVPKVNVGPADPPMDASKLWNREREHVEHKITAHSSLSRTRGYATMNWSEGTPDGGRPSTGITDRTKEVMRQMNETMKQIRADKQETEVMRRVHQDECTRFHIRLMGARDKDINRMTHSKKTEVDTALTAVADALESLNDAAEDIEVIDRIKIVLSAVEATWSLVIPDDLRKSLQSFAQEKRALLKRLISSYKTSTQPLSRPPGLDNVKRTSLMDARAKDRALSLWSNVREKHIVKELNESPLRSRVPVMSHDTDNIPISVLVDRMRPPDVPQYVAKAKPVVSRCYVPPGDSVRVLGGLTIVGSHAFWTNTGRPIGVQAEEVLQKRRRGAWWK